MRVLIGIFILITKIIVPLNFLTRVRNLSGILYGNCIRPWIPSIFGLKISDLLLRLNYTRDFQYDEKKLEKADRVINLIQWYKRMLSFGGLWPADKRGLRFYTFFGYVLTHIFLVASDFLMVFGSLGAMIDNLREMTLLLMVMAKFISLRYSAVLPNIIRESEENENIYKNDEEKRIYMSYINIGFQFSKFTLLINGLAVIAHYLKASQTFIVSELSGITPVFTLPYHTVRFFNLTKVHTYLLVYAYGSPVIYIFFCYSLIGCFVASFIYHMCGQLSVLSNRVRNEKVSRATMDNSLELGFRDIIRKHKKIIEVGKTINSTFSLALFIELVTCTIIQGLCMYQILMNSNLRNAVVLVSFLLYASSTLLVICNYCVAGDCIMQESTNFHNSLYECEWYNMPLRYKNTIIICMIRAQIPLKLIAGQLYIFSMETFTGVMKSSVAYVSILCQIL